MIESAPWFKTWFDSTYYHTLYKHRNQQEANSIIDALLLMLNPGEGSSILDLGCGNGRHSKHLASYGYNVTGIDLAFSSIREAKKSENAHLNFRQHDMRKFFGSNMYDYIFNFFTSFGYFANHEENNLVIKNISIALKPGGTILIDYLNVTNAENHLIPVEEKEVDGIMFRINRWADQNFIYKRIAVENEGITRPLVFVEQVARFGIDDFNTFFSANGLEMKGVYGDYALNQYDAQNSKRLIVLGKKKA